MGAVHLKLPNYKGLFTSHPQNVYKENILQGKENEAIDEFLVSLKDCIK